jgi:hypothetical protein
LKVLAAYASPLSSCFIRYLIMRLLPGEIVSSGRDSDENTLTSLSATIA